MQAPLKRMERGAMSSALERGGESGGMVGRWGEEVWKEAMREEFETGVSG